MLCKSPVICSHNLPATYMKIKDNWITKRIIFIGVAALVTGILIYKFFLSGAGHIPHSTAKVVEIEIATSQDIQQTTRLIGTIRPKSSTLLVAKATGILDSTLPAGQTIQKGTLIAKIDNPDIEKQFNLASSAEEIAKSQYERAQGLAKSGYLSKAAIEDKKNEWIKAQNTLADARIALNKIMFYAPFDGTVGVFKIREGAQVKEGDQIVSFYDPNSLIVTFDIPSSLMSVITDNYSVNVLGRNYPLHYVQRMIDEGTQMAAAYVDIECQDCILGTNIDVDLPLQQRQGVIVIPFSAVFLQEGKTFVYVVKDGKALLTPVELGIRNKEHVEISSGVRVGDHVITHGQARLYPGVDVKVHQAQL